jgi:hypothetical protein
MESAPPATASRRAVLTAALTLVVGLDIALLTWLRITSSPGPLELAAQLLLAATFAALALLDLRVAAAIAVLELVVGGASGKWTDFLYGLNGRPVLDGILFIVSVAVLVRELGPRGIAFGRYTLHGLVVAVALAAWIPFGISNGNTVYNAFADGNGFHFFAFGVVLAALALRGDLGWLRRWLFIACVINAVVTVLLATIALSGAVALEPLNQVLIGRLEMGGTVSYDTGGAFRLYLGSGLFLQVGVVLVIWAVMRQPKRLWPWALLGLFGLALLLTFTRGYWIGAAVGLTVAVAFGVQSVRQAIAAASFALLLLVAAAVVASNSGASLPAMIWDRVVSIVATEDPDAQGHLPGGANSGISSNAVKIAQARVLLGHIAERPVFGWGFGTIAPDYPYGQTYSYELSYLDLAYKTGLVGLLLFLSYPLRLLVDALRARFGRLALPPGVHRREVAVPIAVICSVMVLWATNPYLGAAFGQAPIVLSIAWLDPFTRRGGEQLSESEAR